LKTHLRRGLFLLGVLTLSGCGDSADTLLRTATNFKSEITDRLMKVTDEPSAKKYTDYMKTCMDKNRDLDEKWQKWIKDIEDDFRKEKKRVVQFKSDAAPGTEQWEADARNVSANEDARIIQTREAFITYLRKISADAKRLEREKARIAALVNHLVAEKINEERAKGVENPVVDPKSYWPNLVQINDPSLFKMLVMTGANKQL
jgi:hypothetical protein